MSISNVTEYKRYFGDFRGVDFSSDITQVSEKRFAAAVNIYKDYQTSNGNGIETIPGFRRRVEAPNKGHVYGIHTIKLYGEGGDERKTLVHAGEVLYLWENFGKEDEGEKLVPVFGRMNEHDSESMNKRDSVSFVFNNRLYIIDGKNYLCFDGENVTHVRDSAYIPTTYINIIPEGENADTGTEYEQRNMLSPYFKHTFIVTKWTDADGKESISRRFYMNEPFDSIHEVRLYGRTLDLSKKDYTVDKALGYVEINVDDLNVPEETPMLDEKGEPITSTIDGEETKLCYPEMYAGVEITAKRAVYQARDVRVRKADGTIVTYTAYQGDDAYVENSSGVFSSMVERATVAGVFDNRVFLSGFPGKPNLILYCARNDTGYSDPGYIGVLNYMQDGVGDSPITAMIPIANALLVLKSTSEHEGSVYYHTAVETGFDIIPKVYPSESGLAGTGCLGAAINFLDDPVYVSSLGLEAIGQLSVRYERAREHRSSLVDSLLINSRGLEEAKLCEWAGYLLVLVDGNIFMADSRQKYQHASGDIEYEWYYLENIGVYEGQTAKTELQKTKTKEFYLGGDRKLVVDDGTDKYYLNVLYDFTEEEQGTIEVVTAMPGTTVYDETDPTIVYENVNVAKCKKGSDIVYILMAPSDEMVGGVYKKATAITSFYTGNVSNVYFGTENGVVCSFNFDKRIVEDGTIDNMWYTFDQRPIVSGVSLKMDNCGYPDSNKTTIKKSLVIKTRTMAKLGAKVNVRTNRSGTKEVGSIASTNGIGGMFSAMDFSEFTFNVSDMPMFSLNENQKKWVEKQYTIYTDEFQKPFSLIYIMYRYRIVGKYKG